MSIWTDHPELAERLPDLAKEYSATGIARMLGHGLTRNAVIGKLARMGIPLGAEGKPRDAATLRWNPWTEETYARLDLLAAKGLTASEIASRLDRPRWSVLKHAAERGIDLSPGAILKRGEPLPLRADGGGIAGAEGSGPAAMPLAAWRSGGRLAALLRPRHRRGQALLRLSRGARRQPGAQRIHPHRQATAPAHLRGVRADGGITRP